MRENSNSVINRIILSSLLIAFLFSFPIAAHAQTEIIKNPIVKGYYADPTIIKDKGVYYIYAISTPGVAAN